MTTRESVKSRMLSAYFPDLFTGLPEGGDITPGDLLFEWYVYSNQTYGGVGLSQPEPLLSQ